VCDEGEAAPGDDLLDEEVKKLRFGVDAEAEFAAAARSLVDLDLTMPHMLFFSFTVPEPEPLTSLLAPSTPLPYTFPFAGVRSSSISVLPLVVVERFDVLALPLELYAAELFVLEDVVV